jgi:hypothetical protein
MTEPILCYIKDCWAFFTTKPLSEQWGDDWNDAPYEHNAGIPYQDTPGQITKLAWEANLDQPCDGHYNSPWSVEEINAGAVAWLRSPGYIDGAKIVIPAGTPLSQFKSLISTAGGCVYELTTNNDPTP